MSDLGEETGDLASTGPEKDEAAERNAAEAERIAEALIFASAQPVSESFIAERVAKGVDVNDKMMMLTR